MQLSALEDMFARGGSERSQRDVVDRISAALTDADATTAYDIVEVLAGVGASGEPPADDEALADGPRATAQPTISVTEVAQTLRLGINELSDTMSALLGRATASEQRLLRSLAVGEGPRDQETALISAIAAASGRAPTQIRRVATALGSVPLAAQFAFDVDRADEPTVKPGRPVLLTDTTESADIDTVLASGVPVVIEQCVVGDRIQVHRVGGAVLVFDSTGRDISAEMPAVTNIVAQFSRGDFILDGYATADSSLPAHVRNAKFFDLLFDDEPLVDQPLSERRERMLSLVPADSRVRSTVSAEPSELEAMLQAAIRAGEQGVLLKEVSSLYEGHPSTTAWQLLEPVFTVSLVVVGAEFGTGSRADQYSILYLAARDANGFTPVTRVSRGLTRSMLSWQTSKFAELALPDDQQTPGHISVRPELVLDVRCAGVKAAEPTGEAVGVELIAPRVLRYRQDLSPAHAASIADIDSLRHGGPATIVSPVGAPLLPPATPPTVPQLPARSNDPTIGPTLIADSDRTEPIGGYARQPAGSSLTEERRDPTDVASIEYTPYEPPTLVEHRRSAMLVVAARVLALLWVVSVVAAGAAEVAPDTMLNLSRAGFAVLAVLAVTGWWWTDRLTQNLRRLDGRLPTRPRSISAWLAPVVAVVFLELTVARLEPSESFDVRPALICGVTALAFWRPYALLRRIFATLIRVRHDSLVGASYIIDLGAFGLLWWRLSSGNQQAGGAWSDGYQGLTGVAASASIVAAIGVGCTVTLTRAVSNALDHRSSSQQTRYDHRMLRLRGVDPTDPEVWWALVARRAAEEREAEAAEIETDSATAEQMNHAQIEALVADVERTHGPELRKLGPQRSHALLARLRARAEAILAAPDVAVRTPDEATNEDVDESSSEVAGVDSGESAQPDAVAARTLEPVDAPVADGRVDDMAPAAAEPSDDLEEEPEADEVVEVNEASVPLADDPTGDAIVEGVVEAPPVAARSIDPAVEAVVVDPETPLARLLREAKAAQIDAAIAEQREAEAGPHAQRMVPPRLYPLGLIRLVLIGAFAAVTLAAGRMMTRVLDATTELDNISVVSVADLESARRLYLAALLIGIALVPIWALLFQIYGERAGGPHCSRTLGLSLIVIGGGTGAAATLAHLGGRSGLTILLAIVSLLSAIVAAMRVDPVRHWFDLGSQTLIAWVSLLPAMAMIAGLVGLATAIESSDSLQLLAFAAVALSLGGALVTVFVGLSSIDLEDEIRVTPSMAVRARWSRATTDDDAHASEEPTPTVDDVYVD